MNTAEVIAAAWRAEQALNELIADAQAEAEDHPGAVFDDYTESGNGIIYPENAAPDLDAIRAVLADCIRIIIDISTEENHKEALRLFAGEPAPSL